VCRPHTDKFGSRATDRLGPEADPARKRATVRVGMDTLQLKLEDRPVARPHVELVNQLMVNGLRSE